MSFIVAIQNNQRIHPLVRKHENILFNIISMSNTFSETQADSKQLNPQTMQQILKTLFKMRIAFRLHFRLHDMKVRHHHDKGSKSLIRVHHK